MESLRVMSQTIKAHTLLSVIAEILRLQACFESLFADVYRGASLSTLQKLVLSAVFDARMPHTVPQIGRNLGYPRQVIQRAVSELIDNGLLVQIPNPHHKRAQLLQPTQRAAQMKLEVERRAIATAENFLGTVSARRCDALKTELAALRHAIEIYVSATGEQRGPETADFSTAGLMAML